MIIHPFFDKETATFTYIVADESTKKCAIIDPVQQLDLPAGKTNLESADSYLSWINAHGFKLEWILETHIHADHLSSAFYLKEKTAAKIGLGQKILDVLSWWVPFFHTEQDTPVDGSQYDHLFKNGETFDLGNLRVKVIFTPGHTPACVSYLIEDALFVGDTLFMPSVGTGRADFPGGNAETLYHSIQTILSHPDDTRIFTCHDYPPDGIEPCSQSTVKEQKQMNVLINETISKEEYIEKRNNRDKNLPLPRLLLPSIQVNMRCGNLGSKRVDGTQFIKIPLNKL